MTAIVGHQYGWTAVSEQPMTWRQFFYARQVAAEVFVGGPRREAEEIAKEHDKADRKSRRSRPGF